MKPLPAIVISGFLGAGKTTVLNRMLADGLRGRKVGVIVNDFGKLNVDRHLIQGGQRPVLELSNGCVCCTLQLGLSEAVRSLAARGELDLVVIEASGISVSSSLLHVLKSQELAGSVRLSKVIAVVDARRDHVLHAVPAIADQIVCANLIVLNHCDEVDAATREAATARLRRANADAQIVVTEYGRISADELLREALPKAAVEHSTGHDQRWHAYEVGLADEFDANQLLALIDQLPPTIERVKGCVRNGRELHLLQKVGSFRATLEPWPAVESSAANTIVVISREPLEMKLRQMFPHCRVAGAPTPALTAATTPRNAGPLPRMRR